jgi:hypothetical protein
MSRRSWLATSSVCSAVKGHWEVPGGGHELCPLVAIGSAQGWPPDVPGCLAQRDHSLSCDGLGEADAVAAGLADVGVVQEPVDGGRGQGSRHQLVESIRGWHMFVLADLPCCLQVLGSSSFQWSLRFEGRMLGGTLIFQV